MTALKFLVLTNDDGEPAERLTQLVEAYGTDDWKGVLEGVIANAYAPLLEIKLEHATPNQFSERFRTTYSGTDEVQRKSVTFFLNAVRDAGIAISPYIMRNKKPRSANAKRRSPRKKASGAAQTGKTDPDSPPPPETGRKPAQMLLELLDVTNMGDEEQQALWLLIRFFKGREE